MHRLHQKLIKKILNPMKGQYTMPIEQHQFPQKIAVMLLSYSILNLDLVNRDLISSYPEIKEKTSELQFILTSSKARDFTMQTS